MLRKGLNVIIGRNGAGKSNIFRAIQFVLFEKEYCNLSELERRNLLNENNKNNQIPGYVEVCFDNRDKRFQLSTKEVVLRRTIDPSSDTCRINGKQITQKDAKDKLETAGFSKSNPYYIVEQGKVNDLCLKRDTQRLELLRKLSGTALFEKKKAASLKVLDQEKSFQNRISDNLQTLNKKVARLEKQKDTVVQWKIKRDEKEALQYLIAKREQDKSIKKQDNLRRVVKNIGIKAADTRNEVDILQANIEKLTSEITTATMGLSVKLSEKSAIEENLSELRKSKNDLAIKTRDETEQANLHDEQQKLIKTQLEEIQSSIRRVKVDLEKKQRPKQAQTQAEVEKLNESVTKVEEELELLKARSNSQFKTQTERDKFLNKELTMKKRQQTEVFQQKEKLEKEISELESNINEESKLIKSLEKKTASKETEKASLKKANNNLDNQKKKLVSQRREVWRNLKDIEQRIKITDTKSEEATKKLKQRVGLSFFSTLQQVEDLTKELNLEDKVYGPLFKLVRPSKESADIATVLELSAGNQLNHIVCDDHETCAILMKEIRRRKYGRCTFKPLRQMAKRYKNNSSTLCDVKGFDSATAKSISCLSDHVTFDQKDLWPVIRKVFGKTLLCEDNNSLSDAFQEYSANCISKDGELLEAGGAFRGGYIDKRASRLILYQKLKELEFERAELEELKEKHNKNSDKIGQKLTRVQNDKEKILSKLQKCKSALSLEVQENIEKSRGLNRLKFALRAIEEQQENNKKAVAEIKGSIGLIKKQLKEKMHSLSKQEQKKLTQLEAQMEKLVVEKSKKDVKLVELNNSVRSLEDDLERNLLIKERELKQRLDQITRSSVTNSAKINSKEVDELNDKLKTVESSLFNLEESIAGQLNHKEELLAEKSTSTERVKTLKDTILSCEADIERLLNKLNIAEENEKSHERKVAAFNLRKADISKFQKKNTAELWKKIKKVNEELKQFGEVNELALDQYKTLSDDKNKFEKKKQELDETKQELTNVIEKFDVEKDEVIDATVKKIQKNFTKVFKELVPTGSGRLQLTSSGDSNEVTGISPRVSFDSYASQTQRTTYMSMSQLSGGQKALVALCFIFAIQRCDPAPFYLFDEIDQALDEKNRKAVAKMIHQHSAGDKKTQFITTTFRPEFVSVAETVLAVSAKDKVSDVHLLDKTEAMDFIKSIVEEDSEEIEQQTKAAQMMLE